MSKKMDPSQRCWGKVDLEQFPQLGKHLSIDMDPLTTKQLPSVIVFYKVCRLSSVQGAP